MTAEQHLKKKILEPDVVSQQRLKNQGQPGLHWASLSNTVRLKKLEKKITGL